MRIARLVHCRRRRRSAATRSARARSSARPGAAPDKLPACSIVVTRPPAGRAHVARLGRVELVPDVQAQLGEARIGAHRVGVARPAERHVEHLLDAAGARAHHRDAVAEQDRLVDRMGDEHHGLALVRPLHQLQQLLLQDLAGLRVERGERLVHQQDRRVHGERAHQPDALLHAARELIGIVLLEAGEPDQLEIVRRPARLILAFGSPAMASPKAALS